MNGLCRDCDINPLDGDNTFIGRELIWNYIANKDLVGKIKDELDEHVFLPIQNCFSNLGFEGCPHKNYGDTPAEILHTVLLCMCEYISKGMELVFTVHEMDIMSHVIVRMYEDSQRQSEQDLPNLGPFRNGLMSVKSLKEKERFSRI